jgi:LacI family transcriptional regulator
MNASAPVNEATRARVLAVARELRFAPNGSARALSRRRTGALGVVLPDLYGEFFSELLRGLDQEAQRADHSLLVSSSHHDARGVGFAVRAMRGRVDGLVVMAPEVDPAGLVDVLPGGVPTVLLNAAGVQAEIHTISVDNAGGALAMTRHLLALGHRRIGFIAGAASNADAREREHGFGAALSEADLPHDQTLVVRGDFTEASGWRGAKTFVALADPPTVLFAANDAMAVGALSALRDSQLDVPREMAVVGFDDIPVAAFLNPPLTSVHVGIAELGAHAAALLLRDLAERPPPGTPPRHELLPTQLAIRGSCGSPGGTLIPSLTHRTARHGHPSTSTT